MRCKLRAVSNGILLVLGGCSVEPLPPAGHLLVTIDTDAPLPSNASGPTPIFDAVKLDVVRTNGELACETCSREIAMTRERVEEGATFAIVAEDSLVLRARLFNSKMGAAQLDPSLVVDRWIRMPKRPPEGARIVRIGLRTEDVGTPIGSLTDPVEPDDANVRLPPITLASASLPTSPSEVCIGESLFWMGDLRVLPLASTSRLPRLVRLDPFCVDATEVTVAQTRGAKIDEKPIVPWSGTSDARDPSAYCTFTPSAGENDDRPTNCVLWESARAVCESRGGRLPTRAQFQLLASAFGRTSFVWGSDLPRCDDAIFGRARGASVGDSSCTRGNTEAFLPEPPSVLASTRDRLAFGGALIVGLASNLSEWTRDAEVGSCSVLSPGIQRNPECPIAATTKAAIVGGNFNSSPADTAAAADASVDRSKLRIDLGFRCVFER